MSSGHFGNNEEDQTEAGRLLCCIREAHTNELGKLVGALEETCTLICVQGDIFFRSVEIADYVRCFVDLLHHPEPVISVLAMRGIGLMCEAVPSACTALARLDAIPQLLQYLRKSQFLSNGPFMEELLKCFTFLALEEHDTMIENKGILVLVNAIGTLKDQLRMSALSCVANLLSVAQPENFGFVEPAISPLNTLLMEPLANGSAHLKDTHQLLVKVCTCLAYVLDRMAPNEILLERLLAGEGRTIVSHMVSVIQSYGDTKSSEVRRAGVGVLAALYAASPAIALRQFLLHHTLQNVLSAMLDTITNVEDNFAFEALADPIAEIVSRKSSALPLLGKEHQCVLFLEFFLMVIPRAVGSWDEWNVSLPHHQWHWEDDFNNHADYDEESSRALEEEYQRQKRTNDFERFEVSQSGRIHAVDFEHMRVYSVGVLARPLLRSPLPTSFFHRRAQLLHEECTCFEKEKELSDTRTLTSSNWRKKEVSSKKEKKKSVGILQKIFGQCCSSDTTVGRDEGQSKSPTCDLREQRLFSENTRALFLKPDVTRLLLATFVPSLITAVNSVVNPTFIRHATLLLLRCITLSTEFVQRVPAVAPKALEVLKAESPSIIDTLTTVIRNTPADAANRTTAQVLVQISPRESEGMDQHHRRLLQSTPAFVPTRVGETLLGSLASLVLLVDLCGERALNILDQRLLTVHLTGLNTAFQAMLEAIHDEAHAEHDLLPGMVQEAEIRSQHSVNAASSAMCPLHPSKSRWFTDILTLSRSLTRQLNPFRTNAPQTCLPANLQEDRAGTSTFEWELLAAIQNILSNDELSLSDFQTQHPTAFPQLIVGLKKTQEGRDGENWIPALYSIPASNLVASLARRVGGHVDLSNINQRDVSEVSLKVKPTVHGVVPSAMQMVEDRLIRPLSIRFSLFTEGNGVPSTLEIGGSQLRTVEIKPDFDDHVLSLPFASLLALQREILRRITVQQHPAREEGQQQEACQSGQETTRFSSEEDHPFSVPEDEAATEPVNRSLFPEATSRSSVSSASIGASGDEKQNLRVILFMGGTPVRNTSMTLLDALCLHSPSAMALRMLVEAPPMGQRHALAKALSIWLTQHPIQFAVVKDRVPPLVGTDLGCSCSLGDPYYCTPMHHYTAMRQKSSSHVLTQSLEILHLLLPVVRRPSQLLPSFLRKIYSSVVHDVVSQSATFLIPTLSPLVHPIVHAHSLDSALATFALWNFPQMFPLSLRLAVFVLSISMGHQLAAKAGQSAMVLQRNTVVGAEWTQQTAGIQHQILFHGIHAFLTQPTSAPKKLKLFVQRENLLLEAARIFEAHSAAPVPFDIEFEGEAGSGLGPTLEFYSLVGAALRQQKNLWLVHSDTNFGDADGTALYPNYPLSPDDYALFVLLGSLSGRALKEHRQISIRLHPLFWRKFLGEDLMASPHRNMTLLDAQLEAVLQRIQYLGAEDLAGASLTWTLPSNQEVLLMENGDAVPVTQENVEEYCSAVREHYLVRHLTQSTEAFSAGMQRVFSPGHTRLFTAQEISVLLSGNRGKLWSTPQQLAQDIICDHGYTTDSKSVRYLIDVVGKWNEDLQRRFLLFISGSDCMPVGGLTPKITVVRRDADESSPLRDPRQDPEGSQQRSKTPQQLLNDATLPTVNTCFHYLKLPEYSSPDVLDEKLRYAVCEGQHNFALS